MPQRNVATNFTFEQQRAEINLLAQDFWTQKGTVDTAASTYLKHDGSNAFTGGTLAVPNAFTINANSGAGTLTISGNLNVTGTTTTVNTATLDVTDKNITIAKGNNQDSTADGAGITIDSATDITFNFVDAKDAWVSSVGIEADTFLKAPYGQFTAATTPTTGQGVEVNAPDANTGQIISYDRGNTAYKDLRIKGTGIDFYAGSTNAIVGGFHNAGLVMQSGKTIELDDTIVHSGDTDTKIRFPAADTVQFETAGNNRLSIDSNALFVQAGFPLAFLATSSDPSPNIKSGGTNNADLLFTTGTGNPTRVKITKSGNVGIGTGTDAVDRQLHVKSSGLIAKLESTTANALIMFATPTNETAGTVPNIGANDNDLEFTTGNLSRLKIHSGGKVTIGNDHAGAATWDGDLVVANSTGGRISVGDTGSGERFDIAANGDINLYSYLNGDHINFHTTDGSGTANRFKIKSDGDVEMGGTFDAGRVDCNGLLHIQYGNATNTNYMSSFSNSNGIMHLFRGDGLYIGDNMNTSNQAGGPNNKAITLGTNGNISAANITASGAVNGSTLSISGSQTSTLHIATFQNTANDTNGDVFVLMKAYSNGGGDAFLKFDCGGSDMVVGNRYAGTTNNKLILGAGSNLGTVAGLEIDGNGHIMPDTTAARNLGSSSRRFLDVYTENLNVTKASGNLSTYITATNGLGTIEIAGSTGAFIDLKSPTSDDFDLRIGTSGTGGYINTDSNSTLSVNCPILPDSNGSYDLGGAGNRWANIYSADLQLSNEGSTNEVDGTWGNYTIQEGESDLFLINRRNGKKYKFNLTEVS